ncbi:peptidase M15 [Saccharibacillus sp. O23]|uniref:M15 family metallopeptidase n=1 Tax=Saccharibacillus sp. O23 TaxID=2009338 RepID=UPI000B4E3ADA|nr:M15 family metallopeptidase [Saccharibacillus sp. O23]OWR27727.1 peptidase M15 [Saccharibacillus sp. O23]
MREKKPSAGRGRKRSVKRLLTTAALLILLLVAWKSLAFYGFAPDVPRSDKRVVSLHPDVRAAADRLVRQAADRGIDIAITSGFRSGEEQDRLYRQGRQDAGNIVTNARGGQSYHNYGLAIDFALRDGSDIVWDMERDGNGNGRSDWMEVVELAKALGFDWGGDWENFPDYPHLQMDFGHTLRQLRHGKFPKGSVTE